MLSLALCLLLAAPAAPAPKVPADCDALYYGEGTPKDHRKALACYRDAHGWASPAMVIIMQLNGEGTRIDVAGARAGLERLRKESTDPAGNTSDEVATLEAIIKEREANPKVSAKHLDYCQDVAGETTPALAYCAGRVESGIEMNDDRRLAKVRDGLEPGPRRAFEAARAAFDSFAHAESNRVYQKYIGATIRSEASIRGESFARADFMAEVEALARASTTGPTPGKRSFGDADRALNTAYRNELRPEQSTGCAIDELDTATASREYRAAAHTAQHRWVRYRDAMGKLAAARWPENPGVGDTTRALITEDRIRELSPEEGDLR